MIGIGEYITWKKGEGAWHVDCTPAGKPTNFTGLETFLKAKHAAAVAAGRKPESNPEPGESGTARWAAQMNASMGVYWTEGRGWHGTGFPT